MADELHPLATKVVEHRRGFRRLISVVVIAIGVFVAGSVILFVWGFFLDLSPSHQAKGALPIIKALKAYYMDKGTYPEKPGELVSYLPISITAIDSLQGDANLRGFGLYGPDGGVTWGYTCDVSGKGYELSRQMRDQYLYYNFVNNTGTWLFYPDDGTSIKELHIKP